MKIFILFILFIFSSSIFACSGVERTIEQDLNNAQKVFRGRIISSKPINYSYDKYPVTHEVTLLTSEVFKGHVSLIEKVYTSDSSASCGIALDDNEMVFFVNSDNYTGQRIGSFRFIIISDELSEHPYVHNEKKLNKLRVLANKT